MCTVPPGPGPGAHHLALGGDVVEDGRGRGADADRRELRGARLGGAPAQVGHLALRARAGLGPPQRRRRDHAEQQQHEQDGGHPRPATASPAGPPRWSRRRRSSDGRPDRPPSAVARRGRPAGRGRRRPGSAASAPGSSRGVVGVVRSGRPARAGPPRGGWPSPPPAARAPRAGMTPGGPVRRAPAGRGVARTGPGLGRASSTSGSSAAQTRRTRPAARRGRRGAPVRVARAGGGHDLVDGRRQGGRPARGRRDVGGDVGPHHLERDVAGVGLPAGQQLEEDDPRGVHVDARRPPARSGRSPGPGTPGCRAGPRSRCGWWTPPGPGRSRSPCHVPSRATRTFSGLTSRWTRPAAWASARASSSGLDDLEGLGRGEGAALAQLVAQGAPRQQLHRQPDDVAVLALRRGPRRRRGGTGTPPPGPRRGSGRRSRRTPRGAGA